MGEIENLWQGMQTAREKKSSGTNGELTRLYLDKYPVVEESLNRFVSKQGGLRPELLDPLTYAVMTLGGKRARPILVYISYGLIAGTLSNNSSFLDRAAIIPELPHKGSLVEDDIDDNSTTRGGKLSVFKNFGNTDEEGLRIAKDTYQLLYRAPGIILPELDLPGTLTKDILKQYREDAVLARSGQAMEAEWGVDARHIEAADISIYFDITRRKCAAFGYAMYLGGALAGATPKQQAALRSIADFSSVPFQLMDDLEDLSPDKPEFGGDITESKPILPLRFALAVNKGTENGKILREIVDSRTADPELLRQAVGIMEETEALDYTRFMAETWAGYALDRLSEVFPDSDARRAMTELINFCVTREI